MSQFPREVVSAGMDQAINDLNAGRSAEEMAIQLLAYLQSGGTVGTALAAGYGAVLAYQARNAPLTDARDLVLPLTQPAASKDVDHIKTALAERRKADQAKAAPSGAAA